MWANTEVVGCGVKRCAEIDGEWNDDEDDEDDDDDNDDENQNILLFVCYYGPGYVHT